MRDQTSSSKTFHL